MPAMTRRLLLCTLLPDVLHAIVRLSCSDMHSKDIDAAAAAQDTATALRLTCRTLRAAVDATVAQLDIRASSSADLTKAVTLFPGVQLTTMIWAAHTDH
jgi:outer membrane receptor for ferrienterochelin and colicin